MQVAQFASQKMETKVPKLAIIAGNGSIPFYLIEECENKGRESVSYTHLTLPTTPYV